jgi:hypothetical protein
MTLGQGTSTSKDREPTNEELHFLNNHLTIVFDKENNRVSIGFAYSCPDPPCPGNQPMIAFYVCPKKPCPPTDS